MATVQQFDIDAFFSALRPCLCPQMHAGTGRCESGATVLRVSDDVRVWLCPACSDSLTDQQCPVR
jgi:hypothetical protein